MKKLSIFITADSLLAAVLLVWGQLWIQPSTELWVNAVSTNTTHDELMRDMTFNAGIGLYWTYFAVLLSLLALACIGYKTYRRFVENQRTPDFALGLFFSALILGLAEVVQSLTAVAWKTIDPNSNIFQITTGVPFWVGIILFVTPIFIVVNTIIATKSQKTIRYFRNRWIWNLVILGIVGSITLTTLILKAYFNISL